MPKDRDSFKYKLWRVVVSTPFEYFIMFLIVLNTILLMMKVGCLSLLHQVQYNRRRKIVCVLNHPICQYYHQTDTYKSVLHYMNTTLTGLFTLECAMKIFSYGFRVGSVVRVPAANIIERVEFLQFSFCINLRLFLNQLRTLKPISRSVNTFKNKILIQKFSLQFRGRSLEEMDMMDEISACFTLFFALECIFKLLAFGWRVILHVCWLMVFSPVLPPPLQIFVTIKLVL